MADSHEVDVERGNARARTYAERLKQGVSLLLQHRGLMAQAGVVVPSPLDTATFQWLHDEAAERESR